MCSLTIWKEASFTIFYWKIGESKLSYLKISIAEKNYFKTREELLEYHKAAIIDSEIAKPIDPNDVFLELAKKKIQSPLQTEGY